MSNKDAFTVARAIFMKRANAPEIPALAGKLAYAIAFKRMDAKTQATYFVSQTTLAADLGGISPRMVRNLLRILEPLGLQVEVGNGRGNASRYRIAAELADERRNPESAFSDERRKSDDAKGGNLATVKAEPRDPPTYTSYPNGEVLRTSPIRRENRNLSIASPPSGGNAPDGAPPTVEVITPIASNFTELHAKWARGYPKDNHPRTVDKAFRAYARERAQGVAHATIMAGADVWVGAFAKSKDGVHRLPELLIWIETQGWLSDPTTRGKASNPDNQFRQRQQSIPKLGKAIADGSLPSICLYSAEPAPAVGGAS